MWSREQDKQFENAVDSYGEECPDKWEENAAEVPWKSVGEVKHHYELLVNDIEAIESDFVEIPCYNSWSYGSTSHVSDEAATKKGANFRNSNSHSSHRRKYSMWERCKATTWTKDEHKSFLMGLDKCVKSD